MSDGGRKKENQLTRVWKEVRKFGKGKTKALKTWQGKL